MKSTRDLALVERTCVIAGSPDLIEQLRQQMADRGLTEAARKRDTAKIVDWLIEMSSFQGISDERAIA